MAMDHEPIGERGSPFVVGVLALIAAGLAGVIYETRGTWPAESSGLSAILLVLLGIILIGYAWQLQEDPTQ